LPLVEHRWLAGSDGTVSAGESVASAVVWRCSCGRPCAEVGCAADGEAKEH